MDAFTKADSEWFIYTSRNDLFAWEVAQFFYSFGVDTDLENELLAFDRNPLRLSGRTVRQQFPIQAALIGRAPG